MTASIRLGFLVPPGNPTTEPEVIRLVGSSVAVHFHRMYVGESIPGEEGGARAAVRPSPQNERGSPSRCSATYE